MRLPNAEKAFIDPRKLTGYVLNFHHEKGKHKALLFEQILGYKNDNYVLLSEEIAHLIKFADCFEIETTEFGTLYQIDIDIQGLLGQKAEVRTGWIIRQGENYPRLTTLYLRKRL
jgi:hypothetical protein